VIVLLNDVDRTSWLRIAFFTIRPTDGRKSASARRLVMSAEEEFLIQVLPEGGGVALQDSSDAIVRAGKDRFEAAAKLARIAAETVGSAVKSASPDKGSVEFGLTFEAESGLPVLAKGKVGASITVTLEWGA
jgi:hypothetical protein